MNPIATQQVALDNALVALEKRLKIEKCNARIEFIKPQREETYQVILDALTLSPCYPTFLITTEVPEVYMHQFWNTIKKIKDTDAYQFKLDKKKFRVNTEGMHNKNNVDFVALLWEDFMFQADNREISSAHKENMPYPRFTKVIINHFISKDKTISMRNWINIHIVHNDTLLGTLKFVSKTQDYQMYGALILDEMINQDIKKYKAYKTYLDFATGKATPNKARKFKKVASPSKKLSPVLEEEPTEKPKKAKKPAKKSTTVPTAGVVIRDTPGVSVSKKKAPTKANRSKGMDLLSEAALLEAAQLKKTLKKSKLETHKLLESGSSDGVGSQPKVPNESEDKTTGTDEETGTKPRVLDVPKYQSKSENESWGNSDDRNDDDIDDASNNDDDDVDTDVGGDNKASNSEKIDYDKYENPNLNQNDDDEDEYKEEYVRTPDNFEFTDDDEEYEELYKDVNVMLKDTEHEEEGKGDVKMTDKTEAPLQSSSISSDFANQFINLDNAPPVDNEVISMMNVKSQIPAMVDVQLSTRLGDSIQEAFSTITESLENVILAKSSSQPKSTYEAATSLTEFELNKILLDKIETMKTKTKMKTLQLDQTKGTKSQPKSSGKSSQAKESMFETAETKMPQNQGSNLGNTDDQPNVEETSRSDWFKKPKRPPVLDPDWNGKKSIDFRPPQTWISIIANAKKTPLTFDELMSTPIDFSTYVINNLKIDNLTQEHLVGPAFNLLKGTCKSQVELEYHFKEYRGRQVVPVNYFINNDLEYLKGGSLSRKYMTSSTKTKAAKYDDIQGIEDMVPSLWSLVKHDVFSTKRIFAVTYVKVMKWEGDFPRLNLRDIEDMLLILVQKKLSNLERYVIFDLNVALQMFTRRVVILKQIKDLQLGVESYQKKLNITKPKTFRFDIYNMTTYTAYNNPQGTIYLDKLKRNRLMRLDELYKFCDVTLTSVQSVLHDIASSLRMDYLPKRRWNKLDRKRSHIMIKAIDQQLFERRLIRNLEKFVGGREYRKDFRLLERTI
ncbi:hypothetical protein Tco_0558548 [Tanacetum coccineum]